MVNDDEETERQGTTDAMEVESPRSGEKDDFVRKVVVEKVVSRFEIAANWDYERKETFWT